MSDVLSVQFKHLKMSREIVKVVKKMFGRPLNTNKEKVLGDLLNTKMP